jgi:hypothetical protein
VRQVCHLVCAARHTAAERLGGGGHGAGGSVVDSSRQRSRGGGWRVGGNGGCRQTGGTVNERAGGFTGQQELAMDEAAQLVQQQLLHKV